MKTHLFFTKIKFLTFFTTFVVLGWFYAEISTCYKTPQFEENFEKLIKNEFDPKLKKSTKHTQSITTGNVFLKDQVCKNKDNWMHFPENNSAAQTNFYLIFLQFWAS